MTNVRASLGISVSDLELSEAKMELLRGVLSVHSEYYANSAQYEEDLVLVQKFLLTVVEEVLTVKGLKGEVTFYLGICCPAVLESEDTGVKTQMAVINKTAEDKPTQQKTATTKKKQQTPKIVPNNTLQDDQCRYCKNTGHKAADCAKLAKRRKLEEDPDATRCTHCNAPGHEEPTCYFGANMENRPPKWTLTEAQKKLIENYKNSNKHINPKAPRQQHSSSKDLN